MPTPRAVRNLRAVTHAMNTANGFSGPISNDVLIARYVTYRSSTGRRPWRPRTAEARAYHLRMIGRAMPVPLAEISEDHVLAYRAEIISRYAPETVCARVASLRGLGKWMVTVARIRMDDPTLGMDYVVVPESTVFPTPSHDFDLALACALGSQRPEMYVWLGLMGCMGLRCCEVAWMKTYDIEYLDVGGSILHIVGKGGKRRSVPAPPHITACLRPFAVGRGPMFTRPSDGEPYKPDNVGWHIQKFLRGLGIESTAHPLRKRFARDYHTLDPDVVRQAELMGHSSTAMTRRYIGITPLDAAQFVEEMVRRRMMRGGRRVA